MIVLTNPLVLHILLQQLQNVREVLWIQVLRAEILVLGPSEEPVPLIQVVCDDDESDLVEQLELALLTDLFLLFLVAAALRVLLFATVVHVQDVDQ